MRILQRRVSLKLLLLALGVLACQTARANVGCFRVFELPIVHSESGLSDVWKDLKVIGVFTAPSGQSDTAEGFYHSKNRWMIRFVPDQVGVWTYSVTVRSGLDTTYFRSSFQCDSSAEQGFIRLHPTNPKRWIYSRSGKLFNGVGFGDCIGTPRDSILEYSGIDGGYRPVGYPQGVNWIAFPYSQYLTAYGDAAGFNLYRFSDRNCSYSNIASLARYSNLYDGLHSLWTDTLFAALRLHGFRIFMTVMSTPQGTSTDSASMSATLRYMQYMIDRYSAFVDFWELTNEATPDSLWVSKVAGFFHARDPYHHLVSVSWQQPNHPAIDIISPHWYGKEDVLTSDHAVENQLLPYRSYAKPVIFGEQGQITWDTLSSTRLRARLWSALFNEGIILFWNSSYAIDCCNQYIGWEDRRFTRVLNNFSAVLDTGVVRQPLSTIGSVQVWQLRSTKLVAAYLRNDKDIYATNTGLTLQVNVPSDGVAIWYDVKTGDVLSNTPIKSGLQSIAIPSFVTDVAFVAGSMEGTIQAETLFRLKLGTRVAQFAHVPLEQQHFSTLAIQNTGRTPITMTRGFMSSPSKIADFAFDATFPITLGAGDTVTLPVRYAVNDSGAYAVMLSIEHTGSPAWENIAYSGTGLPRASVVDPISPQGTTFYLYPNPSSGFVHLTGASIGRDATVRVYSLLGKKVFETDVATNGIDLDLRSLPRGTYYIALISPSGKETMQKLTLSGN